MISKFLNDFCLNVFAHNASLLYPLKTSENRKVLSIHGVEKGFIKNKWVNSSGQ